MLARIGADLEIDFLGFELDDRLADLYAVAFLLQPARHARFDDRLTKLGDNDIGHKTGHLKSGQWAVGSQQWSVFPLAT
jgi:hypothetical protein